MVKFFSRLTPRFSVTRPAAVSAASLLLVLPAAFAASEPAAKTVATAETTILPSRYAGDNTDAYIADLSMKLAIAKRTTDPFGQLQDPSAKPVAPKVVVASGTRPAGAAPSKPFSEIVAQIRVTTVMPGEKRFLVGTRSISRGDSFPIVSHGKRYQVEVVDVSSERILFRNLDSDENGELRLDVMPQGMSRGIRGVLAPGMQPTKADAPLDIDNTGPIR